MSPAATRPRGRRPGGEDTRAAIVEAAREQFAAVGYDASSLRSIARAAGVDPSLVHHYFDGKSGLFAAVLEVPVDPRAIVDQVLAGPRDGVGERLARFFFQVWDSPAGRERIAALLGAAASHEDAARMLREFVTREIFGRVVTELGPSDDAAQGGVAGDGGDGAVRAGLAAAQMVGLAMLRYVVRLEAVESASVDELVALVGPTLQRYLVG